jgi:hypothetical protein
MRWKRRDGVMNAGARRVQRVYLVLLLLHTLAASFIWGINTLFLLDVLALITVRVGDSVIESVITRRSAEGMAR